MSSSKTLLAVLWRWPAGSKHAGARFWSVHHTEHPDGRLRDWPEVQLGLEPLGAAYVTVTEGEGLDLVAELRQRMAAPGTSD